MGKPIIYQMLPRLWGEGRMSSIDHPSLSYFKSLGVTHVWYTGLIRHSSGQPFTKGWLGSPYAISDYYDINPYLADDTQDRMAEFDALVRRTHDADLQLVLDFVPNHVGRDYGRNRTRTDISYLGDGDDNTTHWKAENDFYYYPGERLRLPDGKAFNEFPAKATGNRFSPAPDRNDWYDTVKLNYCPFHTGTWDKMRDILLFWAGRGVDAFRCDMVELVPREFFAWAIAEVKQQYPAVQFIAEVYQKENYRPWIQAGFDWLYDKSGLYDNLRAVVENQASGASAGFASARTLSANWQFLGGLQPHMLNFLENHDEQRFASPYFGGDGARTFAPLAVSLLLNTAPFLLYFGEECGERAAESDNGRTSIFNLARIPSLQHLWSQIHTGEGLQPEEERLLARFRTMLSYASEPAFAEGVTFDLGYCNGPAGGFDPDRHFAFLRSGGGRTYLVFCNFSRTPARATLTVPDHAASLGIRPGQIRVEAGPSDASIIVYP
ncbi:MAG: alpha-amylase [Bacteroidales bacterium]|nr:alpha-amylase [Bacteroidales bacterium]